MRSASMGTRRRGRVRQTGLIRQHSLKARAQAVRDHLRPYSYQGRMRQLAMANEVDKVTAQNERLIGKDAANANGSGSGGTGTNSSRNRRGRDRKTRNATTTTNGNDDNRNRKPRGISKTVTDPKRTTMSPPKPSIIKRIKSDSALPKGIGSQYMRPDYLKKQQKQQHVIVTLPEPKLVAPGPPPSRSRRPNSSSPTSSPSFRRLGGRAMSSRRLTYSQTETVPPLLTFDAQETLKQLQLQTRRKQEEDEALGSVSNYKRKGGRTIRRAPQSPGSFDYDDDDDTNNSSFRVLGLSRGGTKRHLNNHNNNNNYKNYNGTATTTPNRTLLGNGRMKRDPSLRDFQLLGTLPDEETELFRQELSEVGEFDDTTTGYGHWEDGGAVITAAPKQPKHPKKQQSKKQREFNRISTFHVDVSESLALSDDDPDDPFGLHGKGMMPSIQLDPRNIIICVITFVVIMTIVLGATLSPVSGNDDDDLDPFNVTSPYFQGFEYDVSTIDTIQERGYVKCGIQKRTAVTTTTTTPTTPTTPTTMSSYRNDTAIGNHQSTTTSAASLMTITYDLQRFNIEQCRAMALIALDNATLYELVWVEPDTKFELLANQMVDIITEGTTYTMGRDVFESNTKTSFTFTTPYFYSGLMIAGNPEFVDCFESLSDESNVDCPGLRICTLDGSLHQDILFDVFNGVTIVPNDNVERMKSKIQSGVCNVVAGEPLFLSQTQGMFTGVAGDPDDDDNFDDDDDDIDRRWKMGSKVLSSVPLSHVTRQDDPEWSTLADLAINAFIISETPGAAQKLAIEWAVDQSFLENDDDGGGDDDGGDDDSAAFEAYQQGIVVDFKSLLLKLIMEYGEYGGYYETHIQALTPPGFGLNDVYDQEATTGLLASYPFGNINELGPGPVQNGTLDRILERGYLICGVLPSRGPWFASKSPTGTEMAMKSINSEVLKEEWVGFDVEFCRGVAASIFNGDSNKIFFVELTNDDQPYSALSDKKVDVVAGARTNLQAMHREPTSGRSFDFSTPYYYDNDSHDAFAFMTLQNDPQWSEYCFWIVMGTIHAEEKNIVATNSTVMPVVALFGELLLEMLSDLVGSVGNYAEIYNNTLEEFIPRSGANLLNDGTGPQLYPIPIS